MDLLATVRKEGARGGRGDFKWSDVQSSSHRENYLGHSLMAPVGRWQKGRDLNWYAKADGGAADGEDPAAKAERERKEEIRRIKEEEQDALARALGFEVAPRNPNMESLGDRKEVDKILKEAAAEEDSGEGGKGVGFGTFAGMSGPNAEDSEERIEGTAPLRPPEALDRSSKSRRRDRSLGDKEGTSITSVMTGATQRQEGGVDAAIQDRGHDRAVVNGSARTTISCDEESAIEIGVAHLTVGRNLGGGMTSTTDTRQDDEAHIESATMPQHDAIEKLQQQQQQQQQQQSRSTFRASPLGYYAAPTVFPASRRRPV